MVNSTAEARRHAARPRLDLSTNLNTLQSPGLDCRLRKVHQIFTRRELFLSVTRVSRILSHLERSKLLTTSERLT